MAVKGQLKPKYKLKLKSVAKIEELLQEMYDEVDKNMVELQEQMNKLSNSVQLNDESVDAKVKYAKAMNDFIANKDKALGRKMEIAKLMTEIHKYNGNVAAAVEAKNENLDWASLKTALLQDDTEQAEVMEYPPKTK